MGLPERFQHAWDGWGGHVPLEVVVSPYRAVVGPIVNGGGRTPCRHCGHRVVLSTDEV